MGKYLFVDSSDVSMNCIWQREHNRKSFDLKNSLKILFDLYKIPTKYQKIAIQLCIHNIFVNADAREVIYGYPFDLTGKPIIEKDNKKFVTGEGLEEVVNDDKLVTINFQTPIEFVTKDEVFEFYLRMYKDGYFKDYIKLLVQLFNKNVDIDLLLDIKKHEPNKRKVLKLYKKEIESRNKHE